MNKAASPPTNVMAYNTSCTHKEIIRDNPNQSSISMILRCFSSVPAFVGGTLKAATYKPSKLLL